MAGAAKYQPYPAYKPSGVEWLGDIPEGWDALRGKNVFSEINERSVTGSETLLSVSEYYGVKPRSEAIAEGEFLSRAESLVGYKKCNADDLVMNIMLAWKRGLGVSRFEGIVSPAYSVFRFKDFTNPQFMHYLLRTDAYVDHFKSRSTGVIDSRLRLYPDTFADIKILVPTLPEQTKIAAFLDYETAKIDALIAKQQRLIALLEEKRQAVISHAVTKGLDPTAPLRPSGIDWLGDVPEHWEVKRLKYLCRVSTGSRNTEDAKEDGKYPFFVRSQTIERINSGPYTCEAILTAGDGAGVGKVYHYIDGQFDCHQRVYMLTDFDELSGKFIFDYLENNFYNVALAGQAKSTVDSLRMPVFLNFEITVPPTIEQNQIVEHVASKKEKFSKLSRQTQSAITLLKERRTALISAAVTGKIDLRDWQASAEAQDTVQHEEVLA